MYGLAGVALFHASNCAKNTNFSYKFCHIDRLIFYKINDIIYVYKIIVSRLKGEFE